MTTIRVVRYRTRSEATEENHRLVAAVYDQLAETRPPDLRYATLRLEDATFLHVAVSEENARTTLPDLTAFQEFQRELGDRVVESPEAGPATFVGHYRLF